MAIDTNLIYRGDCYSVLKRKLPENCVDLIYIDPPFSFDPTYAQLWYDKETVKMFKEISKGGVTHYTSWMSKRLEQCHRVLKETGSIYLHCDWKFGHYLKVEMDNIFGRNNFRNEIVWCYRAGGVSKRWFPRKHDTIFWYSKGNNWVFNPEYMPYTKGTIERGLTKVKGKYAEKGLRSEGTPITDWWIDIQKTLSPTAYERVGYPTQKPKSLLERIIRVSSNPNDIVLDPMCGCGTTIVVAHTLGRRWIGADVSSHACEVMKNRMGKELDCVVDVLTVGLPLSLRELKNLNPFEFQDYICEMTDSEKSPKKVADEGIDGKYKGEVPLQVKQRKVGRNDVDIFETALRRKGKDEGYIVGFSFTRNAHEEAARAKGDGLDIRLKTLEELMKADYRLEDF